MEHRFKLYIGRIAYELFMIDLIPLYIGRLKLGFWLLPYIGYYANNIGEQIMTEYIAVPKEQLEQLYSGLVLGRDSVATEAANYHESHKGYRQYEHEQQDKDVAEMVDAIKLVQKLIDSPPLTLLQAYGVTYLAMHKPKEE